MSWEALGANPVPGDPGVALQIASSYGEVCSRAEEITSRLRALDGGSGPEVWRGQAAEAFRDRLAKVGPDLITMALHYRQASDALRDFARSLDEARLTATRAEADGEQAIADRGAADSRRNAANQDALSADATVLAADARIAQAKAQAATYGAIDPTYASAMAQYEQQVSAQRDTARNRAADARRRASAAGSDSATAQARLEAARRLAAQAVSLRDDAARTTAARIRAADAPGYDQRSFLDRLHDGVVNTVRDIGHAFHDLGTELRDLTASPQFRQFLNLLSDLGDLTSTAGTVLSWFSFIPGVGEIAGALLLASVAFKGLAFAGTALAAAFGNAKWSEVGGRAVDLGFSILGARGGLDAMKTAGGLAAKGRPSNWIFRDIVKGPDKYRNLSNPEEAIGRVTGLGSKGYIRATAAFRAGVKTFDAGLELKSGWTDLVKDASPYHDPRQQDRWPDNATNAADFVIDETGDLAAEDLKFKYPWLTAATMAVAAPFEKHLLKEVTGHG